MKGKPILKGLSCPGEARVATCKVRVVPRDQIHKLKELKQGECLITDDFKPEDAPPGSLEEKYLIQASGFISNVGPRSSHLNMIAFKLKIPAIANTYGQSGENATEVLRDGQEIVLESYTETVEVPKPDGRILRKDLGTVYESEPGNGIEGGLGKPSLADIMAKWGVQKK